MRIVAIVLLCIYSSITFAKDCFDFKSSSEAKECMSVKLDLADKKLLSTYQSNLKILDTNSKQQLVRAQRLWVQYKEADCAQIISQIDDRTHGSLLVFQCLIDKSIQREKELRIRLLQ